MNGRHLPLLIPLVLTVGLSACGGEEFSTDSSTGGHSADAGVDTGADAPPNEAKLTIAPSSHTFKPDPTGAMAPFTFIVTNIGAKDANKPLSVKVAKNDSAFMVIDQGPQEDYPPCEGRPLLHGKSCNVVVQFAPPQPSGTGNGTPTTTYNNKLVVSSGNISTSAELTGEVQGLTPPVQPCLHAVDLLDDNFAFPEIYPGESSTQTIVLENTCHYPIAPITVNVGPKNNGVHFSVSENHCNEGLSPGAQCDFVAMVKADGDAQAKAYETYYNLSSSSLNEVFVLHASVEVIAGPGNQGKLAVSFPGGVDYGSWDPNLVHAKPGIRFALKNSGATPVGPIELFIDHPSASKPFIIGNQDNFCSNNTLEPGEVCMFDAQFDPSLLPGKDDATLEVQSGGHTLQQVTLTGTKVSKYGRALVSAPLRMSKILEAPAGDDTTYDIVFKNVGAQDATIQDVLIQKLSGGSFSIVDSGNNCSSPLSPSDSCVVKVEFSPNGTNDLAEAHVVLAYKWNKLGSGIGTDKAHFWLLGRETPHDN